MECIGNAEEMKTQMSKFNDVLKSQLPVETICDQAVERDAQSQYKTVEVILARLKIQKTTYVDVLTKLHFAWLLTNEEKQNVPDQVLKDEQQNLQLLKKRHQDYKNTLDDLTIEIEQALEAYTLARKQWQEKLSHLQKLEKENEDLTNQLKEMHGCEITTSLEESLKSQEVVLYKMEQQLQIHQNLEQHWSTELASLAKERAALETDLSQLKEKFEEFDSTTGDRSYLYSEILKRILNVRVKNATSSKVDLVFLPLATSDPGESSNCLQLSLSIKKTEEDDIFELIKLEPDNFDLKSDVQEKLAEKDYGGLLLYLSTKWQQLFTLSQEIETLRQSYAVDWLNKDRVLQVLLQTARHGDVICTVYVSSTYPDGLEPVKVTHVGCSEKPCQEEYADCTTLTEVVQRIADFLNHEQHKDVNKH